MTPESLQSIAFRWFEAFNNKQLEKLLSLYQDDAEHFSPKLKIRKVEGEADMLVAEVLEVKEAKIIKSRVYHG